jgi:hypothetical protein
MILCCTVSLVTSEFQYIVEWNENIQHFNSSPSCGYLAHFLAMASSFFFLPSHLFLPPITPFSSSHHTFFFLPSRLFLSPITPFSSSHHAFFFLPSRLFFLPSHLFLPPITPFSYCCVPVFVIEQSGSILLHFVLSSVPQLSNRPSSSRTSFYNVFLDSGVKHPYFIPSPLITFRAHVLHATISVLLYSLYSSSLYHILQALLTCTDWNMLLVFSVKGMCHLYGTVGKRPFFTLVLSSWSDKCFVNNNPAVMAYKFYLPL